MKKSLIAVAVIAVVSFGVFQYANTQIEKKIENALANGPSEAGAKITGKVSTNILTGTLKIDDMVVESEGMTQRGNLKITGLKFYNKENVFSDDIGISFNDYQLQESGVNLFADNEFNIHHKGDGKVSIDAKSTFKDKDTGDDLAQALVVDLSNTKDAYQKITTQMTASIVRNESISKEALQYLDELKDTSLDSFELTIKNNKLLQKSIEQTLKAQYPEASPEDIKNYVKAQSTEHITTNFPKEFQEPMLKLMKEEKSNLVFTIKNKSNITLMNTYSKAGFSPDPYEVIKQDYTVTLTN